MALAMLIFSVVDTGAKLLTESFHAVQIVWFRQLGLLVGVLLFLQGLAELFRPAGNAD